jgi:hypothetical protein
MASAAPGQTSHQFNLNRQSGHRHLRDAGRRRHMDIAMTFQFSATFPISGPNKLPRFKTWAEANVPGVAIHTPPQVPVKATAMTIRLKSDADRQTVMGKLAIAKL